MTDPDERPRPAYGEYATPEEQRARIKQPDPHFEPMPAPHHTPAPPAQPHAAQPAQPAPLARGRIIDRVVTFALLGSGLFTVLNAALDMTDFASVANEALKRMGVDGTFQLNDQAQLWATVGVILLIGGWVLTFLLSWRTLGRGHYAWWIPVVGAVVSLSVYGMCLVVALFTDPSFAKLVMTPAGG